MVEFLVLVVVLVGMAVAWSVVTPLRRIATSVERVDTSLERLHKFLFVRLPQPTHDEIQRLTDGLIGGVNVDDASKGLHRIQPGIHYDPIRKLVDECVTDAYRSAQDVAMCYGAFAEQSPEKQDELCDYFFHQLPFLIHLELSSVGRMVADGLTPPTRKAHPPPVETKVGDTLIEELTEKPPRPSDTGYGYAKAFRVHRITNDGRQDQGSFFTHGGAWRLANRLAGKKGARIVTERASGEWWVERKKDQI